MGCWEDICLKILCWLFLILADYVENWLNLCPSSARRETVFGRLRAAAYDYLRLARNRLYRYHFDGNYSIFPYISLSSWNDFFVELNGCRNNTFIILRYVEGGIPLRHPSLVIYNLITPKLAYIAIYSHIMPHVYITYIIYIYLYIFLQLIYYNFYNFYHYMSTYTRNPKPLEFGDPAVEAMMEKNLGWRVLRWANLLWMVAKSCTTWDGRNM